MDSRVRFLMAAFESDLDLKVLPSVRWHVLLAKACQTPLWPDNVEHRWVTIHMLDSSSFTFRHRWCPQSGLRVQAIFPGSTPGVELRIWLKQGKEKAQTRKGKKTAGKEKRLLARILEKAHKRLSRQNSTKKCVNVRGKGLKSTVG